MDYPIDKFYKKNSDFDLNTTINNTCRDYSHYKPEITLPTIPSDCYNKIHESQEPDYVDYTAFIKPNYDNILRRNKYIAPKVYVGKKQNISPELIEKYLKDMNNSLKPKITDGTALEVASKITNDKELQKVIAEFTQKEAIIVQTKADATPIMKEQFSNLYDKENVIVLDINPQMNNGMQKSNSLISRWYTEVNNIPKENLVTLATNELRTKSLRPNEINEEWVQGDKTAKQIERLSNKVDTISMEKVREILNNTKGKTSEEILEQYTLEDIAAVIKTVNTNIVAPQKKMGYVGALVSQLEELTKDKDEFTIVIPDDCSLSGSSMLCDSVKILDKFIKNNPDKKMNVVFSPLILGDMAQNAFSKFMDEDYELNDTYLHQISAIKTDGSEAYSGITSAIDRVRKSPNVNFCITPNNFRAKHFTETDYFQNIEDPVLKSKLTYLIQGPLVNGYPMFGGFGNCGTMVITPTEEFELEGKTYAGKIPTNSVGLMEVLGHQIGVLNDDSGEKGLFTKGSGRGYSRYCEWEALAQPETRADRIPITVSKDGTISIRR